MLGSGQARVVGSLGGLRVSVEFLLCFEHSGRYSWCGWLWAYPGFLYLINTGIAPMAATVSIGKGRCRAAGTLNPKPYLKTLKLQPSNVLNREFTTPHNPKP